jgi:hypothetical protein
MRLKVMSYRGRIKGGVVVLDDPADLPEGAEVRVDLVTPSVSQMDAVPTLYEQLKEFVGTVQGLPEDFAQQHDHYIHGRPKS